jgi:hypothetical protein
MLIAKHKGTRNKQGKSVLTRRRKKIIGFQKLLHIYLLKFHGDLALI